MKNTMLAVVLDAPGPVEALQIRELPVPAERDGWARIRVEAFGINRSELHTRIGLAEGVTFPRVLGIECVGIVDSAPGTEFRAGQKVVAMMGGMGRTFDGGYAQYTLVPASQVIPVDTDLAWEELGALPEMLQTSYGSLVVGLDIQPGQSLLIRGGTSSIGLATAALAKHMGAVVLSTTRKPERLDFLHRMGVDHPILDDGPIATTVRSIFADGVDAALELVGVPTLPDTLDATRIHGTVCFTGMLSNQWIVEKFYPNAYIPNGVRLTAYGGDSSNLPPEVLQQFVNDISSGRLTIPTHTYSFDQIRQAHADMENNLR
ncbi:MAG: zinc-binding alcohol dehydrogenase family protein, partial [Chloroflexi bacterium]|nr:zinc-binding alcohol dehydrogenase family protein [Chloroflexota bacterium]